MDSLIRGLPHLSPFDVAPFLETMFRNRYREKGFPQTGLGKCDSARNLTLFLNRKEHCRCYLNTGHQRKSFHQNPRKTSKWLEFWLYNTSKPLGESQCNETTCLRKGSSFVGVSSASSFLWLLQEWVLMLPSNTPLQQHKMPFIMQTTWKNNIVPLLNQADVWRYVQAPSNTKWESGASPVKKT